MTTISDVADHAGVSIKTVSRVLNREPHVRPALVERVETSARALNYQPNQAARRLAGKRSFLIAHLYDNPNPNYVSDIQSGAARACRARGYHLVVEPVDASLPGVAAIAERLIATLAPDGVVLTPPLSDNEALVAAIGALGKPVARIASPDPAARIRIRMDERAAGAAITTHLLALGHRRIGIVRGDPAHASAALRFDGYRDALAAAGVPFDRDLVDDGLFDVRSGIAAGGRLLDRAARPTAIFASSDAIALGVMIAARDRGIDVPDDLSVAGLDDTPASSLIWPPLTTVRQPLEAMGWHAVEAVLAEGAATADTGVDIVLPFEIVVRASTTAPPALTNRPATANGSAVK